MDNYNILKILSSREVIKASRIGSEGADMPANHSWWGKSNIHPLTILSQKDNMWVMHNYV